MSPTISEFEKRYAKLNDAQREAVDAIEGPVMVIAGPGTGKTTILTLRIANILQKTDTPPSGILAITFTDAGVKAMRMKLREVIGGRADEVKIYTFHALASAIIAEFPDHFPHLSRVRQLTAIETDAFIRDILKAKKFAPLRPFGNPDLYIGSIVRTIADSKKYAWTPAMLRDFAEKEVKRIEGDEGSVSTRGATKGKLKAEALKRIEKCGKTLLFADVYEAYEEKKREEKAIDFDDLIIEVIVALERDELLLRLVQEKFLYILVDEHQDTNDSQNFLIRKLADFFENPNLFVVGDEKQAIYRFQGASVKNFLALQGVWPLMKLVSLSDNYRSHQTILDAGFSLIENNYGEGEHVDLRIPLVSGGKESRKPLDVITAGNIAALEKRLVDDVRVVEAMPEKTAAVIVRTNKDVERLISLFDANGITASAERGADIFSHPLGSIFFDLIEYLADPSKQELLARTMSVGLWNIGFAETAQYMKEIRAGRTIDFSKSIPALGRLSKDITKSGAIEYLIDAADLSGFTIKTLRDPLSIEVWRGIVALAQDLPHKDAISDPKVLIESLLAHRTSAESKSVKVASGKVGSRIVISTVHGSKGLEYDYVFLPYANEESWMSRSRASYFVLPKEREEGDDVRDARRLFYVALTRARSHVTILSNLSDGLGRDFTPLRFISELDLKHVIHTTLPALADTPATKARSKEREAAELIEFTKYSILERGISVTALNHFMKCPNLFFFRSILRVPEAPSASSEKGNAMHEAMASVWRSKEKNVGAIEKIIVDSVREYFSRSLLSLHEKEILVEELVADAPLVAKALLSHVSLPGTVFTETWAETIFTASLGKEKIECRLHGKLDAVLEGDVKVSVFDYKTREAMSVAAIKGETKSDDGGYWRQLVFYALLLSGNPKYKTRVIEPSLVFIRPDEKGRCPIVTIPVTPEDMERVRGEIKMLLEKVWSGDVFGESCDDPECDGCRLMKVSSKG